MPDITLDQFESEAKSFLDSNASLKAEEKKFVWGEGSDKVTLFDEKTRKQRAGGAREGAGVATEEVRRRLRLDHGPVAVWRP